MTKHDDDDDDAFDARGRLKDGRVTRLPMLLKDGSTVELEDWQREVIWAHRLGLADAADLHRPGPRYSSDQVGLDAKAKAYADGVREMCDAWKTKPVADAAGEFRGQQPGDQCTINGAPGHLDHRLQCVPDKRQDSIPRTMSADAAQKIRDEAWRASVEGDENAWRGPGR